MASRVRLPGIDRRMSSASIPCRKPHSVQAWSTTALESARTPSRSKMMAETSITARNAAELLAAAHRVIALAAPSLQGKQRCHRAHAGITCVTKMSAQSERVLERAQQAVMIVRRRIAQPPRTVVGDDDRRDMTTAGVVRVDHATRLRRAGNPVGLAV